MIIGHQVPVYVRSHTDVADDIGETEGGAQISGDLDIAAHVRVECADLAAEYVVHVADA